MVGFVQFRAMVVTVPEVSRHVVRDQHLIEVLWYTGARVQEATHLKPDMIGDSSLTLINLKQRKQVRKDGLTWYENRPDIESTKVVSVPEVFCEDLKEYCKDSIWVFPSNRDPNRPLSRWYVWHLITNVSKKLGLDINPQTIRHRAAIRIFKETGDLNTVKEQLGYSDTSVARLYTKEN